MGLHNQTPTSPMTEREHMDKLKGASARQLADWLLNPKLCPGCREVLNQEVAIRLFQLNSLIAPTPTTIR